MIEKFTKTIFATLTLTALAACSPSQKSIPAQDASAAENASGLIGGQDVPANHDLVRYVVGIYVPIGDKAAICTGSLLPNNMILTAAHCVGPEPKKMLIIFGNRIEKGAVMLPVDGAAVSQLWARNQNNEKNTGDIALLHYKGQTPAGFKNLPLARAQHLRILDQRRGALTLLAGYGINDGVRKTGSGVLRMVSARVEDARFSETEVRLNQTQGKGACHGDSGGPAIVFTGGQARVWGVTSRGIDDPNDDCSVGAIYTNVVAYEAWIDAVTLQWTRNRNFVRP